MEASAAVLDWRTGDRSQRLCVGEAAKPGEYDPDFMFGDPLSAQGGYLRVA